MYSIATAMATTRLTKALELVRNGVLIVGWASMVKENIFSVTYGIGVSMSPTIPDGSFVVVERLSRRWRSWERGDVVQLLSPTRCHGESVTKRILALVGGTAVGCKGSGECILIEMVLLQEGDVVELQPRFDKNRKGKITVPKGHVWVEGDNPTCSVDSRHYGAVPVALLVGRPLFIVSFGSEGW